MKTVAILQARTGSSRLPCKVLADLCGAPLLERCITRARRARRVDILIVATTRLREDRPIVELSERIGVACHRGASEDVLDRYREAARAAGADVIVRLTGDNPLVSPELLDDAVEAFMNGARSIDYLCNRRPRTFPVGLDLEVFSMAALERAWRLDEDLRRREHVTPFMLLPSSGFRLGCAAPCVPDLSRLRWTVDTAEDLEACRALYQHFRHDEFGWREAAATWQAAGLEAFNAHVVQREC